MNCKKSIQMIKRTLTFMLSLAMIVTSLYVAPVANAEEIVEETGSEEVVLDESGPAGESSEVVEEQVIGEAEDVSTDVPAEPDKYANIKPAKLVGHESTEIEQKDLVTSYTVSAVRDDKNCKTNNEVYKVTVNAQNLIAHKNADETKGHWVGIAIPQATASDKYYKSFTKRPTDTTTFSGNPENTQTFEGDSNTYDTIYINVADKSMPEDKKVYISKKVGEIIYDYIVDVSNVSFGDVASVEKAPLVDKNGGELAVGDYTVTANYTKGDVVNVKIKATNLVKHTASKNTLTASDKGYWVGIAVPDGPKYFQSVDDVVLKDHQTENNYGDGWETTGDSQIQVGPEGNKKPYQTYYYNVNPDNEPRRNTVYLIAKNGASFIKYVIDLSEVTLKGEDGDIKVEKTKDVRLQKGATSADFGDAIKAAIKVSEAKADGSFEEKTTGIGWEDNSTYKITADKSVTSDAGDISTEEVTPANKPYEVTVTVTKGSGANEKKDMVKVNVAVVPKDGEVKVTAKTPVEVVKTYNDLAAAVKKYRAPATDFDILSNNTDEETQAVLKNLIVIEEYDYDADEWKATTESNITWSTKDVVSGEVGSETYTDGYLLAGSVSGSGSSAEADITVTPYKSGEGGGAGDPIIVAQFGVNKVPSVKITANDVKLPSTGLTLSNLIDNLGIKVGGYKAVQKVVNNAITFTSDYSAEVSNLYDIETPFDDEAKKTETAKKVYNLELLNGSTVIDTDAKAAALSNGTTLTVKVTEYFQKTTTGADGVETTVYQDVSPAIEPQSQPTLTVQVVGVLDKVVVPEGTEVWAPTGTGTAATKAIYDAINGNFTVYVTGANGPEAATAISELENDADAKANDRYVWSVNNTTLTQSIDRYGEVISGQENGNDVTITVKHYAAGSNSDDGNSVSEHIKVYGTPANGTIGYFKTRINKNYYPPIGGENILSLVESELAANAEFKVWENAELKDGTLTSASALPADMKATADNTLIYAWEISEVNGTTDTSKDKDKWVKAIEGTPAGQYVYFAAKVTPYTAAKSSDPLKATVGAAVNADIDPDYDYIYFTDVTKYTVWLDGSPVSVPAGGLLADQPGFKQYSDKIWYYTVKGKDVVWNPAVDIVNENISLRSSNDGSQKTKDGKTTYTSEGVFDQTYNGKAYKPAPIVKMTTGTGDNAVTTTLKKNAYTVKYYAVKNNKAVEPAVTPKMPGTYEVRVTIKADGTEVKSYFDINQLYLSSYFYGQEYKSIAYNEKKKSANLPLISSLKINGVTLKIGVDYTYTIDDPKTVYTKGSKAAALATPNKTYTVTYSPVKDNAILAAGVTGTQTVNVTSSTTLVSKAKIKVNKNKTFSPIPEKNEEAFTITMGDKTQYPFPQKAPEGTIRDENGADITESLNYYTIYDFKPVTEGTTTYNVATPVLDVNYYMAGYSALDKTGKVTIEVVGNSTGKKYFGYKTATYTLKAANKFNNKLIKSGSFLASLKNYNETLYKGDSWNLEQVWLTKNTKDEKNNVYTEADAIKAINDSLNGPVYGYDYDIIYSKNKKAGTASVVLKTRDTSVWTGTIKLSFKIQKPNLGKASAEYDATTDPANPSPATTGVVIDSAKLTDKNATVAKLSTGSSALLKEEKGKLVLKDTKNLVKYCVAVSADGKTRTNVKDLKEGVDYTITYKNNKPTESKNMQIIIKGKGSYTGTAAAIEIQR